MSKKTYYPSYEGVTLNELIPSMELTLRQLYHRRPGWSRMTLNEWLDACTKAWGRQKTLLAIEAYDTHRLVEFIRNEIGNAFNSGQLYEEAMNENLHGEKADNLLKAHVHTLDNIENSLQLFLKTQEEEE